MTSRRPWGGAASSRLTSSSAPTGTSRPTSGSLRTRPWCSTTNPANRLFTPELVVGAIAAARLHRVRQRFVRHEQAPWQGIQIGYNKEDDKLFTFRCSQLETRGPDAAVQACDEAFAVSGQLHVGTSKVNAATSGFELARVMGPLPAARNVAQSLAEDEITGGLATEGTFARTPRARTSASLRSNQGGVQFGADDLASWTRARRF